jgi:hypothetical protein
MELLYFGITKCHVSNKPMKLFWNYNIPPSLSCCVSRAECLNYIHAVQYSLQEYNSTRNAPAR